MGLNIDILVNENKQDLTELEKLIGYRFTDLRLLQKALIHSSYAFEQAQGGKDNQILEFVGDAVLDLVIGYALSKRFPSMREGELTRIRASLVNESHLAEMARSVECWKEIFRLQQAGRHGRSEFGSFRFPLRQ